MNITSRGRYGLRLMVEIARRQAGGFVSIKGVAEGQEISPKYLEAIAAELKKAGLIESGRGKEGGYRLTRPPGEYSVWEILTATGENLAVVSCLRDGDGCARAEICPTVPMWRELDGITRRYLEAVTLEELLSGERWNTSENKEILID